MEFSHGQTAEDMKEITLMIRRKDMVYSSGQTAGNTKEDGKTVNSMASVPTPLQAERPSKANGKKAKDSTGYRTNENIIIVHPYFQFFIAY